MLLEGAELALEKGNIDDDESTSQEAQLSPKEVLSEILCQEMQAWHRDHLPIILLIPWPSSRSEPLELCVPGAIEGSVVLPVPLGWKQREAVLRVCLQNLDVDDDDDNSSRALLPWLTDVTAGFLPSDLVGLCRAAAMSAVSASNKGARPTLSKPHFQSARALLDPAPTRGTCAVKPEISRLVEAFCPGLDAVVGQPEAVGTLREMVIQPFSCMQKEKACSMEPPIGVLLSGNPGSGKTFLAAQLAAELSAHLFNASPADLLASRVGDAEKHLAALFRSARGCAPSIIVLEDIENLAPAAAGGPSDSSTETAVSAETCIAYVLRNELDTIKARRQEHKQVRAGQVYSPQASEALVLVIGTTATPHQLPPWLCVPHRFSMHIRLEPHLTHKVTSGVNL